MISEEREVLGSESNFFFGPNFVFFTLIHSLKCMNQFNPLSYQKNSPTIL